MRHTCPSCQKVYCIACGEPINTEKTQRPNAATGDDPLFHCSNLQGVILGNGLSLLEHVYADVIQEAVDDSESTVRTNKRKKTDKESHASPLDADEEDDVYYGSVNFPKGKKAKGGTGYAGNVKEDVGFSSFGFG